MIINRISIRKTGNKFFERWEGTCYVDGKQIWGYGFTARSATRDLSIKIQITIYGKIRSEYNRKTRAFIMPDTEDDVKQSDSLASHAELGEDGQWRAVKDTTYDG